MIANFLPLAVTLLLAVPRVAAAQVDGRPGAPAARDRAAVIAALPRGEGFTVGGERYRLLDGARAVRRAAHESEADALARVGAAPADVLDRKGRLFLVVRSPGTVGATIPRTGQLAAVNARTGRLGVVSGELEVRTRPGVDPAALARAHGLEVVSSAPRLSRTFLRVPPGSDLAQVAAALGLDPDVASVEIEVIERVATAR